MTILEEARHSLIIIEHEPPLNEEPEGMMELISQAMRDAAKDAASPALLTWN